MPLDKKCSTLNVIFIIFTIMKEMAFTLKRLNAKQITTDRAYWLSKSVTERMNAIEFLRSQYPDYENQLSAGLQRVCRILRKK